MSKGNGKSLRKNGGGKTSPADASGLSGTKELRKPGASGQKSANDAMEPKAPEFLNLINWIMWVWKRIGWKGRVALVLAGMLALVAPAWWHSDKLRNLPLIKQALTEPPPPLVPIPKADPSRYSVAVALFENDLERQHHTLVVSALTEFEGIQVLTIERAINPHGADNNAAEKAGHQKAKEFLRESGAQALVWGEVLRKDQESVPKLFWTIAEQGSPQKAAGRYVLTKDLGLPEIFWSDLSEVLLLLVATQAAEFQGNEGHYIADRLKPFIEKTRGLLNKERGGPRKDVEQRSAALA